MVFYYYLILNKTNNNLLIEFSVLFHSIFCTLAGLYFFQTKSLVFSILSVLIANVIFCLFYLLMIFDNINFILLIIMLVTFHDVTAYLGGKTFGKLKIYPNISPNKTLEGTLTGVISSIPLTYFYSIYFNLEMIKYLIFGIIISFLSSLGDLLVSYFKRQINVKDTGSLIPGHGGFLDRFDGYIFCIPASLLFVKIFS